MQTATEATIPAGRLLKPREAAALLNLTSDFLARDRMHGPRIPFLRVGKRAVRYRRVDLEKFIASSLRAAP